MTFAAGRVAGERLRSQKNPRIAVNPSATNASNPNRLFDSLAAGTTVGAACGCTDGFGSLLVYFACAVIVCPAAMFENA
jgi:hypothetical protein